MDGAWIYCGTAGVLLAVGLAAASYRSLGHAVDDDFIVTRSGALSRNTAVLQRTAVIGWTLRQSVLQRRAGLMTATAAGDRAYQVPDAGEAAALDFADRAIPGLLEPFLAGQGDAARGQR